MGKIKISEATQLQLNWAVAKCKGFKPHAAASLVIMGSYQPSIDWEQGGPIIEREQIEIAVGRTEGWAARKYNNPGHSVGPTPLIAAMRCYVASKLGDEVEIPEELK
jgi:hypothetical protein